MTDETLVEFDRAAHDAATPIYLVGEAAAREGFKDFTEELRALAQANAFQGDAGGVLAGVDGVLVGVGRGDDPFALSAAAERLPEGDYRLAAPADPSALLAWRLGGYRFTRYRETARRPSARLIAPEGADVDAVGRTAEAVFLTRDLINTPAGDLLPDAMEREARALAAEFDAQVETITGDDLLTRNFPMIHAVGRASAIPPRLIDMTWKGGDGASLTLVGKGVCFDAGGLNLKNAGGMSLMKKDMGGAANALGLARMIMSAGLPISLRVLIPAVENAVSAASFRPGDILTSRKGLTVEIGNTDAEGRLVLADAMTYGGEAKPDFMVTLATLTGAARVALGPDLPPFYCDDEDFVEDVLAAATDVADPVWRMPLWADYDQMLASPVADLNNAPSGGFAGSVLAALFLKRFAPAGSVWSHFDIYAWRPKAAPGRPIGGEAQAIRALFTALERRLGE